MGGEVTSRKKLERKAIYDIVVFGSPAAQAFGYRLSVKEMLVVVT